MKNLIKIFTILTLMLMMHLMGCKDSEESNPLSFIDGYTVNLLEEKGTTYAGDYFPIEEGYTCNYSGSVNMLTKMEIPGYDPIEEPTIAPTLGMLKVLALRDIPLESGTIPLYPIVDLTEIQGQLPVADTSRFFNKDAEAVYIRAIKISDGSYLEVENPVYIKSSLVVGESWETAPKMDMTQLLTAELGEGGNQSDITLNAKSKFFVVGHEMISLPIGTKWAMRLEQANDITMTGTLFVEGTTVGMNITAKLATIYHMIADTGIVHQNTTGPLTMKITAEGQTATITIDIAKSELKLTSLGDNGYYKNNSSGLSRPIATSKLPLLFHTPTEQRLWNISQIIANVLIKRLSF